MPRRPIYAQSTLPTVAGNMRLLRAILLRERVTLVHAHQAFSALALEALVHARTMGYRVRTCAGAWEGFILQSLFAPSRLQLPPPPSTLHITSSPPPTPQAVFTDHSLFGFADGPSIATNKMLKAALSDANAVICVSHTSRENTVLRACLPPARVSVIPNGARGTELCWEPSGARAGDVPSCRAYPSR